MFSFVIVIAGLIRIPLLSESGFTRFEDLQDTVGA